MSIKRALNMTHRNEEQMKYVKVMIKEHSWQEIRQASLVSHSIV